MDQTLLKQIEEAGLNAWPAVRQVVFDGWLLRFTGGYSKRVNSVNYLYPSTLHLDEKIRYCEEVFNRLKLPMIFRLVDLMTEPGVVEALDIAGYRAFDPTLVLGCHLIAFDSLASTASYFKEASLDQWVDVRAELSGKPVAEWQIYKEIVSCIVPEKTLLVLYEGDQPVACGMGVMERALLGYFSIYTAEDFRRQGYSQQVMQALTQWGIKKGASFGYLQVEADNDPALALYKKLGFEKCYSYEYYRLFDI